ncbi:MAG TPA: glucoamylase family protein [Pyrinomonadaceae bacterium]|nr:glucoamylase family protein [Pyrinomonadaceae bacterium]
MNKKRRVFNSALCTLTSALLLLSIPVNFSFASTRPAQGRAGRAYRLSAADEALLEDLSRRAFQYFLDHADPETGLVLDRARTSGEAHAEGHPSHRIASSAATGFGLTALCVGAERGWVSREEAARRALVALRFFAGRAPQQRGWFLHWMDARTGERRWRSEHSSIDTALLLGGALTARRCFDGRPEVARLATLIYERVDFRWMLAGHPSLLSHGWRPETGFLKPRWDTYSEHLILQLLAVGSPTHPVPPSAWRAWERKRITYAGYTYLGDGPLFTHQFSHAWVDFRGRREGWYPFTDYFENSVRATRAHRQFCLDLSKEFPGYTEDVWGVTASDSDEGYVAWGGPPRHPDIDGTVVPCAAGGSLMFAPDIALAALRAMKEKFGARVYGRYGFTDAFNPNNGWTNPDVIGIDLGITLLSAENLRTGRVWEWFMSNEEIPRAMRMVGLRKGSR